MCLSKVSLQRGLPELVKRTPVFKKIEIDKLQTVFVQTVFPPAIRCASQTVDPRHGTVDYAGEFSPELRRAVFDQALPGFFRGKPCRSPVRFLGLFQTSHFAKVGSNGNVNINVDARLRRSGSSMVGCATEISREGNFFDPAMNARLFKSLKRGGVGAGKAGLDAAFGEYPTPAAGLHQQELNTACADAVTNGGNLLASFRRP